MREGGSECLRARHDAVEGGSGAVQPRASSVPLPAVVLGPVPPIQGGGGACAGCVLGHPGWHLAESGGKSEQGEWLQLFKFGFRRSLSSDVTVAYCGPEGAPQGLVSWV